MAIHTQEMTKELFIKEMPATANELKKFIETVETEEQYMTEHGEHAAEFELCEMYLTLKIDVKSSFLSIMGELVDYDLSNAKEKGVAKVEWKSKLQTLKDSVASKGFQLQTCCEGGYEHSEWYELVCETKDFNSEKLKEAVQEWVAYNEEQLSLLGL